MQDHVTIAYEAAASRVRDLLARPMPSGPDEMGYEGEFDPWGLFPSLYGSYDSEFDKCAIEVLCEVRGSQRVRSDLAADMFREMLCTADLCDYGSSPRVCFATPQFKALLPSLIESWRTYSNIAWTEEVTESK